MQTQALIYIGTNVDWLEGEKTTGAGKTLRAGTNTTSLGLNLCGPGHGVGVGGHSRQQQALG